MFETMTDEQFRRHVVLVCHTLAVRWYARHRPGATRAAAWGYAVQHWREYEDGAIDFCTVQAIRQENREIARERLN